MNAVFRHRFAAKDVPDDLLSATSAERSVELRFLQRCGRAAGLAGSAALDKARQSDGGSFSDALARMGSPVFKTAARALEASVPEDRGFGKFGE